MSSLHVSPHVPALALPVLGRTRQADAHHGVLDPGLRAGVPLSQLGERRQWRIRLPLAGADAADEISGDLRSRHVRHGHYSQVSFRHGLIPYGSSTPYVDVVYAVRVV